MSQVEIIRGTVLNTSVEKTTCQLLALPRGRLSEIEFLQLRGKNNNEQLKYYQTLICPFLICARKDVHCLFEITSHNHRESTNFK